MYDTADEPCVSSDSWLYVGVFKWYLDFCCCSRLIVFSFCFHVFVFWTGGVVLFLCTYFGKCLIASLITYSLEVPISGHYLSYEGSLQAHFSVLCWAKTGF